MKMQIKLTGNAAIYKRKELYINEIRKVLKRIDTMYDVFDGHDECIMDRQKYLDFHTANNELKELIERLEVMRRVQYAGIYSHIQRCTHDMPVEDIMKQLREHYHAE